MKVKLSITVEEETYLKVREALRKRQFRNMSHAFDDCVFRSLGEKE